MSRRPLAVAAVLLALAPVARASDPVGIYAVIDKVMARKPAEDHPPLPAPDYAYPAIPRAMADRFGNDDFHKMLDDFAAQSALAQGGIEGLISNR